MTPREEWAAVGIILLLLVGLAMATHQRDTIKAEAVKRGVAEWVINPNNGETTFQLKDLFP